MLLCSVHWHIVRFMTLWSIILLVGGSLISLNIVARNTASINKYLLDPLEGRRTSDLAKPETVDDINDHLGNALQDYDPLPGMPLEEKHSDRHSIFFCKVTTQASAPPSSWRWRRSRQPASWFMRPQWSLLDPTTWTPPSDWTDVDSWERTPEMSLTIKLHTKLEYVASRIVMYARPDRSNQATTHGRSWFAAVPVAPWHRAQQCCFCRSKTARSSFMSTHNITSCPTPHLQPRHRASQAVMSGWRARAYMGCQRSVPVACTRIHARYQVPYSLRRDDRRPCRRLQASSPISHQSNHSPTQTQPRSAATIFEFMNPTVPLCM